MIVLIPKLTRQSGLFVLCLLTVVCLHPLTAEAGQQKVVRKSSGVLTGSATKRIEPEYPARARQQGISGKVVVQVSIDEKGVVISASAVSGPDVLREAAVRASRRWRFTPTYLSGVAVGVVGEISFNFELDGDSVNAPGGDSSPHGRTVSANSPMLLLSERQRRALNKRLDVAAPVEVKIGDQEGAWLGITRATIRTSRLDIGPGSTGKSDPDSRNKYAIKAEVVLQNRTDQKVVSAGLEFTNISTNEVFYCYPNALSIGGRRRGSFQIPLMLLSAEPSHLSVQAVGALFGDSSIWGAFPFPPPLKSGPNRASQALVDSKPELISSIHPTYTDEARKNRVRGSVRLLLEIGADGRVRAFEILNGLPDGLTDEAVRIARQLSFKPALRSGDPVSCQINLDIEFKGG